ncbi:MAG: cytochrome c [Gemmatimonadales bacterium]|jgi:mono/diheme cytochrome c family protein
MLFSFKLPAAFLWLAASSAPPLEVAAWLPQTTEEGRALFEVQCKGCHSAGSDRLIGPGLAGVNERRDRAWLVAFITAPDRMVAEGDPIAVGLMEEYQLPMPNLGLTEVQAEAILDYLAGAEVMPTAAAGRPAQNGGDAAVGRALFTGERRLEQGGAACISCHGVAGLGALGGGTLAKDLTTAAALYGNGLAPLLEAPPFPAMQAIYGARPLASGEIADLSAFLAETEESEGPAETRLPFLAAGFGGMVLLAAAAGLLWRGRLRGVRRPLIGEHT